MRLNILCIIVHFTIRKLCDINICDCHFTRIKILLYGMIKNSKPAKILWISTLMHQTDEINYSTYSRFSLVTSEQCPRGQRSSRTCHAPCCWRLLHVKDHLFYKNERHKDLINTNYRTHTKLPSSPCNILVLTWSTLFVTWCSFLMLVQGVELRCHGSDGHLWLACRQYIIILYS